MNARTKYGNPFGIPKCEDNRYVDAYASGGGDYLTEAFAKWCDGRYRTVFEAISSWWHGAHIHVVFVRWPVKHMPGYVYGFGFPFPECWLTDMVANTLGHILDWLVAQLHANP